MAGLICTGSQQHGCRRDPEAHQDKLGRTASELLTYLTERLLLDERKRKTWPATPSALGTAIKCAASVPRAAGFTIQRRRGTERTLVIVPPGGDGR